MRTLVACALILLAPGLGLAGGDVTSQAAAEDWKATVAANAQARARFLGDLARLKPTHLYYLNPGAFRDGSKPTGKKFQGWAVVADKAVNADAGTKLVESMRQIVTQSGDGAMACFEPHHGMTLTAGSVSYDVVICFECWTYDIYDADGKRLLTNTFETEGQARVWDAAFSAAGLPSPH